MLEVWVGICRNEGLLKYRTEYLKRYNEMIQKRFLDKVLKSLTFAITF